MGRQAGVFARKNTSLVRDELPEQIDVLEVKSVNGEIDFGLRTRCANFAVAGAATFFGFIWTSFSGHRILLDFAMERVPTQGRVVFFNLQLFGLQLFVACRRVARRGFAFLACFGAFDRDDFARHKFILFPSVFLPARRPRRPRIH